MTKTIQISLHKGHGNAYKRGPICGYATVIDDDFTRTHLLTRSWYLNSNGYARTSSKAPGEKRRCVYLHQIVFEHYRGAVPEGHEVDHRNRNKLDCVPKNLRAATYSQQIHNQFVRSNNTSGHRGVNWNRGKSRWESRIMVRGKLIRLGYFENIQDAVEARKKSDIQHFGQHITA